MGYQPDKLKAERIKLDGSKIQDDQESKQDGSKVEPQRR